MAPTQIAIADLAGQLLLRRIAEDDFVVEISCAGRRLTAGRILLTGRGGSRPFWLVSVTGPHAGSLPTSAEAASLDKAMAAFRTMFDAAVDRSRQDGGALRWHIGADRVSGV